MPYTTLAGLECSRSGERLAADRLRNLSPAGAPLLARYDLERAAAALEREKVACRPPSMWRYHEVLPAPDAGSVVSLGEGMTPLLETPRLGRALGLPRLLVKDEGGNPTGSFKDRGMSVAVTMARALGASALAIPTAGNAGGSAAAYGARAGLPVNVLMPADAAAANREECERAGARLTLVDGFLDACAREVAERAPREGWFELSTFKEPYRVEGKKTMAYELVEQLDGALPDAIVYPTGGGTGLVAMWRAFAEMEALGWIGRERPRMISVQAEGCAPLVDAWRRGLDHAPPWASPTTRVHGLRAPRVLADFLCLAAIRDSGGAAIAVPDDAMFEMQHRACAAEGVAMCPEGSACLAALPALVDAGALSRADCVVVFNTATALKH